MWLQVGEEMGGEVMLIYHILCGLLGIVLGLFILCLAMAFRTIDKRVRYRYCTRDYESTNTEVDATIERIAVREAEYQRTHGGVR